MQIEITSIDDIINLVDTDRLTNEQFIKIVEAGLNCFVLNTMTKDAKLKALIYWRDEILTQTTEAETPLFFELDIDVVDGQTDWEVITKKIISDF